MRRIAHIINPVVVSETSDLFVAQPITFESVKIAREFASRRVDVDLYSAQYPEDRALVPREFCLTPDLERSVLDVGTFANPRKLPLIGDILQRLYDSSDAEYFVYTNVDIALMPYFYAAIDALLKKGYDALSINRRTIHPRHTSVRSMPLLYAEVGKPHPGSDCFVFRRDAYPRYNLGTISVGAFWIGTAMLVNLGYQAEKLRVLKNTALTFHIGDDAGWRKPEYADYEEHNARQVARVIDELQRAHGPLLQQERLARYLRKNLAGRALLDRLPESGPTNLSDRDGPRGRRSLPPIC